MRIATLAAGAGAGAADTDCGEGCLTDASTRHRKRDDRESDDDAPHLADCNDCCLNGHEFVPRVESGVREQVQHPPAPRVYGTINLRTIGLAFLLVAFLVDGASAAHRPGHAIMSVNLDGDRALEQIETAVGDGPNVFHRLPYLWVNDHCGGRVRHHVIVGSRAKRHWSTRPTVSVFDADGRRARREVLAHDMQRVVVVRLQQRQGPCPVLRELLRFEPLRSERIPPEPWRATRFDVYALEAHEQPGLEVATVLRWTHPDGRWEDHIVIFAFVRELDRYEVARAFARTSGIP